MKSVATHEKISVFCQGITKTFGDNENRVTALRGVDLSISKGELMMLVGPSGCGKTTLISILAGILHADQGVCEILGTNIFGLPKNDLVRFRGEHIGFIFQSYNLLPSLTIGENVAIPLIINGVDRHVALSRARNILGELGLGNRTEAMPLELSGGQQQRVAIARALVHEPEVLVCDEPTSALDHTTGAQIMDLMCRIVHDRGATLIIVTHDNRIFGYADRIAHMDDGKIMHVGNEAPSPPLTPETRTNAP